MEAYLEPLDDRLVGLADRDAVHLDPFGFRVDSVGAPDDWHGDHVDFFRHPDRRAASVADSAGVFRHWPRSVHPAAVVDGPDERPVRPAEDPVGLLDYPDCLDGGRCGTHDGLQGASAGLVASLGYHVVDPSRRN